MNFFIGDVVSSEPDLLVQVLDEVADYIPVAEVLDVLFKDVPLKAFERKSDLLVEHGSLK